KKPLFREVTVAVASIEAKSMVCLRFGLVITVVAVGDEQVKMAVAVEIQHLPRSAAVGRRQFDHGDLFKSRSAIVENLDAFAGLASQHGNVGPAVAVPVVNERLDRSGSIEQDMLGVVAFSLVFEPGESSQTVAKATNDQVLSPISVEVGDSRVSRPRQTAEQPFDLRNAVCERDAANLAGEFVGRKGATDQRHNQIRPLEGETHRSAIHLD